MRAIFIPVAMALIFSSCASPTISPRANIPPPPSNWTVSNYTEGCSPGGCQYGFNVQIQQNNTSEAYFSTYCSGTDVADKLQACQDTTVTSNEIPGLSNVTLVIQHTYTTSDGVEYFIQGNHTIVENGSPYPNPFTISTFQVRAVA